MKINKADVLYRKATIKDKKELIARRIDFLKEIGNIQTEEEEKLIYRKLDQYMETALEENSFRSWVAVYKDKIIGISGMVIWRRLPLAGLEDGKAGYIFNMYTLPEYRGNGICTVLLNEIIKEAKDMGLRKLHLHSTKDGYHAYKNLGFTEPEDCELVLKI